MMTPKKSQKSWYFALGDILKERGLTQRAARIKYGFDQPGPGYISKTGFQNQCHRPRQISDEKINVLCNAMGLTPGDLWRSR